MRDNINNLLYEIYSCEMKYSYTFFYTINFCKIFIKNKYRDYTFIEKKSCTIQCIIRYEENTL